MKKFFFFFFGNMFCFYMPSCMYGKKGKPVLQQSSRMCQGNRGKHVHCSDVKLATEKLPERYQQGIIQQIMGHLYCGTLSNS